MIIRIFALKAVCLCLWEITNKFTKSSRFLATEAMFHLFGAIA